MSCADPTATSLGFGSVTSALNHELGETRLAQVGLLDGSYQLRNLFDVGLERIVADHPDVEQVSEADVRPVEIVLDRILPREFDEFALIKYAGR